MDSVTIGNDIDEVMMPTKAAVTLGIILNELAANALKHAFDPVSENRFTVSLEQINGNAGTVVLAGTGPHEPPEAEGEYVFAVTTSGGPRSSYAVRGEEKIFGASGRETPKRMGLFLVDSLARQMDGGLDILWKEEPEFRVRFRV